MRLLAERELEKQRKVQEKTRKESALAGMKQFEEKRRLIKDNTIQEENDTSMEWQDIQRKQEEQEERERIQVERDIHKNHPSASQIKEKKVLFHFHAFYAIKAFMFWNFRCWSKFEEIES